MLCLKRESATDISFAHFRRSWLDLVEAAYSIFKLCDLLGRTSSRRSQIPAAFMLVRLGKSR